MKNLKIFLTAMILSLAFVPNNSKAETAPTTITSVEKAKATSLLARLDEINAMNKSGLNSSEKKNLRKEVRSIKHQLRVIGGGIYLSAGALLLIIILAIILF
jgi:hypothetical protein